MSIIDPWTKRNNFEDRAGRDLDQSLLSLGPLLPLALVVLSFFSLQPLIAIGYASYRFYGDTNAFYFSIIYYILPGGMIALAFGALRVGQMTLRFTGKVRTLFGLIFLLLQFTVAALQVWITGGEYIGGAFAHTITTDFVSLSLIVCVTFVPPAVRNRKWWFFPLFVYAYVAPASALVYYYYSDASLMFPARDGIEMLYWTCGVAVQVAVFVLSVDFRSWRDFAGQFFNP